MTSPENPSVNEVFWETAVQVAADDPVLVRALSEVVLGLPLTEDDEDAGDYGDVGTYLFLKYGLGQDDTINRAMDLCEAKIIANVYGNSGETPA